MPKGPEFPTPEDLFGHTNGDIEIETGDAQTVEQPEENPEYDLETNLRIKPKDDLSEIIYPPTPDGEKNIKYFKESHINEKPLNFKDRSGIQPIEGLSVRDLPDSLKSGTKKLGNSTTTGRGLEITGFFSVGKGMAPITRVPSAEEMAQRIREIEEKAKRQGKK